MKKILSTLLILLVSNMLCKAEYDFSTYMYPFGFRTYYSEDSNGKTTSMSQFSFKSQSYNNFLVEEVYIGMGMNSATSLYRYHTEDNMVVSDVQIRNNALTGTTKYQDKLTLFAFPKENKPYKWTEIDRGDQYQCTSEYVYLNFSIYSKSYFLKAIKITRDNSYVLGKEKHRVIEKSYWVSDFGRIITIVNWDGAKRISSKLDVLEYFQEMSKEEYNTYIQKKKEEERRAKEAAEAEALLRKKMAAFKEKTKPRPFEEKYAIYQQPIIDIIESQIYTLDSVGNEPMIITITSNHDVKVQNGAFSASSLIGESIKKYLKTLLNEGKIQLDTAINPTTNKSTEIPLVLKISQIPSIVTQKHFLNYKKGLWYDAETQDLLDPSSSLGDMLYTSAAEFRLRYKKAKRIAIEVKYIDFNNKLHLKGVEKVYTRKE